MVQLTKKLLAFTIIILFIGTSVTLSTGNISKAGCKSNNPPYVPSDPNPADGSFNMTICPPNLSWTGGDPDGDDVFYDVYFGGSSPPPQVGWNQSETWFFLNNTLKFEKTYYWYIVAWDECGAYTKGPIWSFTTEKNLPPYKPSQPDPFNGDPAVPTEDVALCWVGGDPNECDTVLYDVYFDDVNPPIIMGEYKIPHNCWYIPYTLPKYKTYYWRVDAWDSGGLFTEGDVWSFTTGDPSYPSEPIINGPTQGKVGVEYTYTFNSTYESGYDLIYFVHWGDGSSESVGPSPPGVEVEATHTWHKKGSYEIRAKAQDENGLEGPWGELQVTMPRDRLLIYSLFLKFSDSYPFIQYLFEIFGRNIK